MRAVEGLFIPNIPKRRHNVQRSNNLEWVLIGVSVPVLGDGSCCGGMSGWFYGYVLYGSMVIWLYGFKAEWFNGYMAVWF